MTKPRSLPVPAQRGVTTVAGYLHIIMPITRRLRQATLQHHNSRTLLLVAQMLDRLHHTARLLDAVGHNPAKLDDLFEL